MFKRDLANRKYVRSNCHAPHGRRSEYLDVPGATATYAGAINDSGAIVGGYCPNAPCVTTLQGEEGFIYKNGTYNSVAIPGEYLTSFAAINNKGVIMGNYLDAAEFIRL